MEQNNRLKFIHIRQVNPNNVDEIYQKQFNRFLFDYSDEVNIDGKVYSNTGEDKFKRICLGYHSDNEKGEPDFKQIITNDYKDGFKLTENDFIEHELEQIVEYTPKGLTEKKQKKLYLEFLQNRQIHLKSLIEQDNNKEEIEQQKIIESCKQKAITDLEKEVLRFDNNSDALLFCENQLIYWKREKIKKGTKDIDYLIDWLKLEIKRLKKYDINTDEPINKEANHFKIIDETFESLNNEVLSLILSKPVSFAMFNETKDFIVKSKHDINKLIETYANNNAYLKDIHLKIKDFFISLNKCNDYLSRLYLDNKLKKFTDDDSYNLRTQKALNGYYEYLKGLTGIGLNDVNIIKDEPNNKQVEVNTEQDAPQKKENQHQNIFINNFDNVEEQKVFDYFKENLVMKKYILEDDLIKYLKAAFEEKKPPSTLFNFNKVNTKKDIVRVFYKYYKVIALKPHGKQINYIQLLGDYFNGFETDVIKSNFNK